MKNEAEVKIKKRQLFRHQQMDNLEILHREFAKIRHLNITIKRANLFQTDYSIFKLPLSDKYIYVDPQGINRLIFEEIAGSRYSSTQISSIFPPCGKINRLGHCHGIRAFPNPCPHF